VVNPPVPVDGCAMETSSYDTIPGVIQDSSAGVPTTVWNGSSAAPVQNSFLFQPISDGSNIFQSVSSTVSNFLAPQGYSAGIFASNPVTS